MNIKKAKDFIEKIDRHIVQHTCGYCLTQPAEVLKDYAQQALAELKEQEKLEVNEYKQLKKIAAFAYDIHTRDPVNVKNKWGCCGVNAEIQLIDMIEQVEEQEKPDGKSHRNQI